LGSLPQHCAPVAQERTAVNAGIQAIASGVAISVQRYSEGAASGGRQLYPPYESFLKPQEKLRVKVIFADLVK